MTNISTMMERRAEITAEIDAIPTDLTNEQEFKDAFDLSASVSALHDRIVVISSSCAAPLPRSR
jgi:hypothetical protein